MGKHILITGVCGYIGTALAHHLFNNGFAVSGLDRNPAPSALREILNQFYCAHILDIPNYHGKLPTVSAVVHLAGASRITGDIERQTYFKENKICSKVLRQEYPNRTPIYFASTLAIYDEERQLRTTSDYAMSKLQAENYANYILRLATVVGPNPEGKFHSFVDIMMDTALREGKIYLWQGDKYRPTINLSFLLSTITDILNTPIGIQIRQLYQCCTKIRRYAETIKHFLENTGNIPVEIIEADDAEKHLLKEHQKNTTAYVSSKIGYSTSGYDDQIQLNDLIARTYKAHKCQT